MFPCFPKPLGDAHNVFELENNIVVILKSYFIFDVPICVVNIHIGELQIASLYAKLNGLKKIYFSGYFIRGNPVTMHTISYGINYWSKVIQLNLAYQTSYLINASYSPSPGRRTRLFKNADPIHSRPKNRA